MNLENEVKIELAGETRVLKASFEAMCGIERDLKCSVVRLIDNISTLDMGVEQTSLVIYHGLRGNLDTRMSLAQVGEAVMEKGLNALAVPTLTFLRKALNGVSMGKPRAAKKAA